MTNVDWLETLSPWPREGFGIDRMRALLAQLGDPQAGLPAVHVVGTNGKSTTTRMVEELLLAGGVRAGAYLSPHVRSWAERVRVAGAEADLEAALHVVRPPAERLEATQFEVLTAAAFVAFRDAAVEAAAVEAGLGGRHDATNVLDATRVVVLTNVSLEHTDVLGTTREAIAAEKLAVVQPRVHGRRRRARMGRACAGGRRRRGDRRARRLTRARARRRARVPGEGARRVARSRACRWRGGWSGDRARSVTGRTTPRASGGSWSICPATTIRSWHRSSPTRTWTGCSRGSQAWGGGSLRAVPRARARCRRPSSAIARAALFDVVEVRDDPHDALALAHALGEPVLVTGSLYLLTDLEAGSGEARP